jgi:putative addiction module component (TIGR02574 family)
MSVDTQKLLGLPAEEKLRVIELLWDNLGESTEPIPLPDWAIQEGVRRRDEMLANPSLGLSHDEVWNRIDGRKGSGG